MEDRGFYIYHQRPGLLSSSSHDESCVLSLEPLVSAHKLDDLTA